MWITRFRVLNFASFEDSGWIELDQSVNLFIGQNNSGKSALLKALNFPLSNNPHKNPRVFRGKDLKQPILEFDLKTSPEEVFRKFSILGADPIFPCLDGQQNSVNSLINLFNDDDSSIELELRRSPEQETAPRQGASIGIYRLPENQACIRLVKSDNKYSYGSRAPNPDNLGNIFSGLGSEGFFYFDAQRLNIGKSAWSSPNRLLANAGNLATVLAYLQGARRPLFDIIEGHVIDILGGIDRITVAPRQSEYEILIWPDRNSFYEELAFGLNDSGTGVGQLLAILTAMVTSEQAVLLIDEINSFLHPAAVKRLLVLLRSNYSHHQYIISTHSADVIASSNAEKIYTVTRDGFSSTVKAISITEVGHAREVSSLLGISMMDVFGYDRMVWVEGPTEEICFPYIARQRGLLEGHAIGFAPVSSTSAISSARNASRSAIEIYEQAGKRLSPLLSGMAFALDREKLSDEEVLKLERSRRKLRFLPRRCMECYLIDVQAISYVLSDLDGQEHSTHKISELLSIGGEQRFGAQRLWQGDIHDLAWLKLVDAALLLSEIFNSATESRVEYRKTRDGISLLKHIMQHNEQAVDDLVTFVDKVLEISKRDTAP